MAASHDAWANAFGHPHLVDEVPDARADAHQVGRLDAQARRIFGMHPHRVRVRQLVEPLAVAGTRVDQRGQAEGRDERVLALGAIEVLAVHMALDVLRQRVLRPAPVLHCWRPDLELLGRRGKASARLALHLHACRLAINEHTLRAFVDRCFLLVRSRHGLHVAFVHIARNEVRAVLAHVLERRHAVLLGFLGQARHRVLEDPLVVLVYRDALTRAIGRLVPLANAQAAIGVDAPRQLDPELVFFPHLAGIGLVSKLDIRA